MRHHDVGGRQHHVDQVQEERQGAAAVRSDAAEDTRGDQREHQVDGDPQREDHLKEVDEADHPRVRLHDPHVGPGHRTVATGGLDAPPEMQHQGGTEEHDEEAPDHGFTGDGVRPRRDVRRDDREERRDDQHRPGKGQLQGHETHPEEVDALGPHPPLVRLGTVGHDDDDRDQQENGEEREPHCDHGEDPPGEARELAWNLSWNDGHGHPQMSSPLRAMTAR